MARYSARQMLAEQKLTNRVQDELVAEMEPLGHLEGYYWVTQKTNSILLGFSVPEIREGAHCVIHSSPPNAFRMHLRDKDGNLHVWEFYAPKGRGIRYAMHDGEDWYPSALDNWKQLDLEEECDLIEGIVKGLIG